MFYFRLYVFTRNVLLKRCMYVCLVINSLSHLSVDMLETFLPVSTLLSQGTYSVFVFLRVVLRAYLVLLLIADSSVCTTPGLLFKCLKPFVGCMSCVVLYRAVPLCRVGKILHTGTVSLNFILYFQQTTYFL